MTSIAGTYRDERRSDGDSGAEGAELAMTYVGERVADELSVAAIHRLYRGVGIRSSNRARSIVTTEAV